ncbi:uncharacterized protein LOC122391598 [Amphibalanus amphitrite]|uniref:uncharacterized protein LOC122391598 n=1 Tax=Amphibalanus amphitrite TaxID=1232801 RepID=UPI001C9238AB|nr:uncharacterized protein LOC122391598 [Amphibalanus amphitrite]
MAGITTLPGSRRASDRSGHSPVLASLSGRSLPGSRRSSGLSGPVSGHSGTAGTLGGLSGLGGPLSGHSGTAGGLGGLSGLGGPLGGLSGLGGPLGGGQTSLSAGMAPAGSSRDGRGISVLVQMLDDSLVPFTIQMKWPAKVLFEMVCRHLGLLESDYFGLEYCDSDGGKVWLDMERPMSRQLGLSPRDLVLWLCVKFYTPDPAKLEDELTRYLFSLQIRRDLAQGQLKCNSKTAAVLVSYIVQSEHGDYDSDESPSRYRVMPGQDAEMQRRIIESHRRLAGQPPSEAELNLLETARRCELYGMKMHPAKDHEGVPLNLTVAHMGIVVFQHFCRINTFSWGKIRKISFKRRRFLVKLHPDGTRYYKDTVDFFFESRNHCKNFWKRCVEHHGFFRCLEARHRSRSRPSVLPKGSQFRFTGRTQKQVAEYVRQNLSKHQVFNRSQSFRASCSNVRSSSLRSVGTSLSANPLIPIDMENEILTLERTPVSLSYGSATITSTATPRSPPSLTDHDTAELDTTSRGEVTTSAASTLPPARSGHLSPDSELSSAPTDSYCPAARRITSRLSRSSPSLSETAEESEEAASSGTLRAPPLSGRRRQLSRDSSSLSSVVEINTVIDRRQLLDDTVSHDSYDLLDAGPLRAAGWALAAAEPADDDDDDDDEDGSGAGGGETVNLIPFGTELWSTTAAGCRPVLVPGDDACPGPLILPPEPFNTYRLEGVKTLPRAGRAAGSAVGAATLQWRSSDRLSAAGPAGSEDGAPPAEERLSPESPVSEHGEYRLAVGAQEEWLQVRSVPGTLERAVLQRLNERRGPAVSTSLLTGPRAESAASPQRLPTALPAPLPTIVPAPPPVPQSAPDGLSLPAESAERGASPEVDEEPSSLSSSRTTGDESTLQYDTVPDESELEVEAPPEFSDRPPPLPPPLARLCYGRRRLPGEPPGCGGLLQVAEEEEEGSEESSTDDGGQETPSGEEADFPSPPSSLLDPLRPAATLGRPVCRLQLSLPVAEQAPPQRVLLAGSGSGSGSDSSSERAETGGADSEPDAPLEELPGDGEMARLPVSRPCALSSSPEAHV